MIKRSVEPALKKLASKFKALAIIGPRQSGKTTLARSLFPDKSYISLENPDLRAFATDDPRGFLAQYQSGAILDEIQRVPELFSYLQQVLDETKASGKFILTGSNNFLMQENISQSLAGRLAYIQLLPFATSELRKAQINPSSLDDAMLHGGYPPIFDQEIPPDQWFPQYIQTYIERDVRQLKQIQNLPAFERFVRLCAGRTGQLLNKSSIAVEAGIDNKTVDAWLGILEQSFIIKLVQPYHKNFNKRIVRMPKLYFIDTGLVCALLGIRRTNEITYHPLRGNIFENFAWSELYKVQSNLGLQNRLYFWRDNVGHELDVIVDHGKELIPVEIKSGATINASFFKGIAYWRKLAGEARAFLIYGGNSEQKRSNNVEVLPWNAIDRIGKVMAK